MTEKAKFTHDVRSCFVPRPGYKFVAVDYNNLELLAVAHQLYGHYGHCVMMDIINSGDCPTDLHSKFAALLMSKEKKQDISYEYFCEHKSDPEFKAYRTKGKPMSLGRPGGMGYDTIRSQCEQFGIKLDYKVLFKHTFTGKPDKAEKELQKMFYKHCEGMHNARIRRSGFKEFSIVIDEVVSIRKALDELYPELCDFLTEGHKKYLTGESGYVKNEYGEWVEEPFYAFDTMGVRRDFCTYTAFCNGFLMQTPSAVGAKKAVYDCFRTFENNDDVHMLAFIHDEVIAEVKDDENLHKHVGQISEILIDSMKEVLPTVRVAVEYTIHSHWAKDGNDESGNYWKDHDDTQLRYYGDGYVKQQTTSKSAKRV